MSHRRHIHQNWPLVGVWYRLADAIGIAVAMLFAVQGRPIGAANDYLLATAAAIIVYGLFAESGHMYRSWRGVSANREALGVAVCWALAIVVLLGTGFAIKRTAVYSRVIMLVWFVATPALVLAGRILTRLVQRSLHRLGYQSRRCAIIGVNELAFQLARNIAASPELGLNLAGFFDDRPEPRNPEIPPELGRRVGTIDDLVDQARRGEIDRIYITFPMRAEDRIRGVLDRLGDAAASVYLVPDFFVFQLLHSRWTDILGLPVVSVFENPLYGVDGLAKRLCDIVLGGLAFVVLALPMLAVAAAIRLTSSGPALFRQRRYGLDGREIRIWKFRTMTVCEDGESAAQARPNDPRVTRLGAFLRRTSLDELPQLLNVLAGSMSLVGPRPHAHAQNEEFRTQIAGYMLRHKIKPGMTGLAQVHGWRGMTDVPEKMQKRIEFDHRYIREWSLWLDLKILVQTVFVVVSGKNAY